MQPLIRSGAKTKNGDGAGLRAGEKTDAASRATGPRVRRGAVAVVVELLVQGNHFPRAGLNAKAASFALVLIYAEEAPVVFLRNHHAVLPGGIARNASHARPQKPV